MIINIIIYIINNHIMLNTKTNLDIYWDTCNANIALQNIKENSCDKITRAIATNYWVIENS